MHYLTASKIMKKNYSKLPLRKGVGIVLLNDKNKVFVAKRIDNPKNFWQMPQGGVDGVENYYEAALRLSLIHISEPTRPY